MKVVKEGNITYQKGIIDRGENKGIRANTKVKALIKEWDILRNQSPLSRTSIRVFEGDLYSLMDDNDFYEDAGCRKLINIMTFYWDSIRELALIEESEGRIPKNWGDTDIRLKPDEQLKLGNWFFEFDKWITRLANRFDLERWNTKLIYKEEK